MKHALLLLAALALLLPACTAAQRQKALSANTVTISYDDFGPPELVRPVLGERGANPLILVTNGGSKTTADPRKLNTHQALRLLRTNARQLSTTPQDEALRRRMSSAYKRIAHLYTTRRNAMLSSPPFFGRGSSTMQRMLLIPPVPPSL